MRARRLFLYIALPLLLAAQEHIPFVNPDGLLKDEKLEAEQIEINRFGAGPSEIQRARGRFLLLVTNYSKDPNAAYTLEPQVPVAGSPALLRIGGPHTWIGPLRLGAVINARIAGVWLLKSVESGRTLCTITIQ